MNNNKTLVLLGASQGIGKSVAEEFAAHGYNMVLLSRNEEAIKALSETLTSKHNIKCAFKICDVSVKVQVQEGVIFSNEFLEHFDIVIINAGIGHPEWMHSFSSDGYKEIMSVNAFGIAHALEFIIPVMRKQGYGTFAGVTSLADVRGYMGSAAYASSKAAASTLLESARVELKLENIKVVTIRPGWVKTAMTSKNEFKMPFIMEPEKAARIIRKGVEKGKSVVQFPYPIVNATRIVKNLPNWIYDWAMKLARPVKK